METIKEEDLVERALKVIKQNLEWVLYLQQVDRYGGFLFLESTMMNDIKDAIYLDNPIHSSASLALCLQECSKQLKNDINENENENENERKFRLFH